MIRPRTLPLLIALAGLAACSDPLADFERLSDVPVAEGAATAAVAPGAADQTGAPLVLPTLLAGLGEAEAAETDDLGAEEAPIPVAAPAPASSGLFGALFGGGARATPVSASVSGPTIAPGSTVPYGVLATVCGIDPASLGTAVAAASGYTVYDSDPRSTAQRTHYVSGFGDGCARQFTAALALFGDVGTHELHRYASDASGPYSATDTAYEEIKGAVCGAASGTPCGAGLDQLAQRTTFLTVYESFGTSNGWADILLSDGAVVADDF